MTDPREKTEQPDIVARLRAISGETGKHQFELISLIPQTATDIECLRHELAEARKLPALGSVPVNDAAWHLVEGLQKHGPLTGPQWNNIKGIFYDAMEIALAAEKEG